MAKVTVKEMLQAGLHFGHQTRRWNPKMKPFIYGPRNGIYIINLDKSKKLFDIASDFVINEITNGGTLLFVGTKRQARNIIKEEAVRCGMPYVDHRWLGGMLTNFQTIKNSIERLKSIESMQEDGSINRFPKKEILLMGKERVKLERNVGGIKNMRNIPTAILVIDPRNESIAINEAKKLKIPVIALTDTNCDPDGIDYIIPGNDDAIRSIQLICSQLAEGVLTGQAARDGEDASDEAMVAAMGDAGTEQVETVQSTEATPAAE
ncbi:MAG: 30S ribosomal protein S2 [Desulfocapsa sp.]|uniref:Small ribosomal subunit protein uS2 n=1 Tax=Desulfotalea psychrophila TaxID=84980 RepID=A0ABS3AUJ0_9BACT|nr:30S ribosomal protein S2 [Desulfocapsa sp.]MBN4068765.1 30S ribosomal protein S2 [Desulfotalea psychrophila]